MIGPKEQTVRDGIDPREEYTRGEQLLLRAKLAEARAEDLQAEVERLKVEVRTAAGERDESSAELKRWKDAHKTAVARRYEMQAYVERLRGILKAVVDWSEDDPEDGGAPWSCRVCGETGIEDLHDERCPVGMADDALARDPDPIYPLAVRRVVAWDGGGGLTEDIESAYIDAAVAIVDGDSDSAVRMDRRLWHLSSPEYDAARDRVIDRLARYKRHRDESAGYR